MAGLTYGPLLGIFILAIFTKIELNGKIAPSVLIGSFVIASLMFVFSEELFQVKLGFSISIISTALTLIGCLLFARKVND